MTDARERIAQLEAELEETYRSVTELTNELERAKEGFQKSGLHDGLTQLPNRDLFQENLERAIELARREKRHFPVLVMDLNGFKGVNDTLGHSAGDTLLQEVAMRLSAVMRKSDMIARLGGDEFGAVLMTAEDIQGAILVAEKIIGVVEQPLTVDGKLVDIGISIGIAMFPEHGGQAGSLIESADEAMYEAKRTGSGYTVLNTRKDLESYRQALFPGELRQAISNDEIVLVYQPKIDMRSGRVIGTEALARWQHPDHGLLMPAEFISAVERTAVVRPFTLAILRIALEQLHEWRRAGSHLSLAINLSARALYDWELPQLVLDLLQEWNVPPDQLILEITESTLQLDPEKALEAITRLCSSGVGICIDDFGTGFSCLSHLKDIPLTEIKIGMPFVHNFRESKPDLAAVRSIINMCDFLDVRAVAEGVECEDTWDDLRALGCHAAQGYFVSYPLPKDQFRSWVEEWESAFLEVHQ